MWVPYYVDILILLNFTDFYRAAAYFSKKYFKCLSNCIKVLISWWVGLYFMTEAKWKTEC